MNKLSQKDICNMQMFATFPCKRNSKIPSTRNGFKDAQFCQDVQAMFNAGYNPALACEKSGVVVIDIDYHDKDSTALEDLQALEIKLGAKLPRTLTQSTASGSGRHLIYSAKGITNPIGKIGKFCDLKFRGYIMIAPSVINGRQYEIIDGIDENGDFIIAELPQAWLDYINKPIQNRTKKAQDFTKFQAMPKVYSNIDVDKMFRNCKFLQYCKEQAYCLSEPEWFSMISVLAQIKGSDELIHGLSAPYGRYSYEETQKKIDLARKFGRPQTCEYISTTHLGICNGCKSAVQVKDEDKNNV